jgi:hypothetical protein
MFNTSFRVLWAARYMKLEHAARLKSRFAYLDDSQRLTSLWVERIA